MENYTKGEEISVECIPPFPKELIEGVAEMVVKEGSKYRNIINYVEKQFEDQKCRRVLFRGIGEATAKCISCVEVFKRACKETLYQWNAITFSRRSDVWVPDPKRTELSKLLVHVDVPAIFILISRDPFPSTESNDSFQTSGEEVTGFPSQLGQSGEGSSSGRFDNPPKPRLKRSSEPNKWKRPPKKTGTSADHRSSTGSKPL